jgi:small subunit ribosomal protein S21
LVSVKKRRDQSKDSMLRRFSRMVIEEGIIDEVRDRMYYKSPSLIKKERTKEQEKKRRRYRD